MQIGKKHHLEKAVSTDPTRECLNNIWTSTRHAFATDGKILAAVPISTNKEDSSGWLTPEALKLARRASKGLDTITITLNGQMILPGGVTLPRPKENRFPTIFHLLRKAHQDNRYRIGINAGYLKDLADALGSEELILECGNPTEAVMVHPLKKEEGTVGLIMPIRLSDERRTT